VGCLAVGKGLTAKRGDWEGVCRTKTGRTGSRQMPSNTERAKRRIGAKQILEEASGSEGAEERLGEHHRNITKCTMLMRHSLENGFSGKHPSRSRKKRKRRTK